ncbi:hypothetical protein RN001_000076 [Aquatica leii]|uniref:SCAN domain-containing protein 3 n=1 Tax=Aquatica leii TaxID=1421715 RepID=A0AAN7Q9D1_9COLE|nr:hypothetical protein RN001_000076 [Aquatica leii]
MVGRYRGFISYLKQNVSRVLAIHCVIHRQHLVAKNLSVRFHESLQLVIDAVNRIRSNALIRGYLRSCTNCQEDDVSTYVQHLNALYSDFETSFEAVLTMVIPPWIINPYGDIEETNVIIQKELIELSTNEELKVQFKNGYQQFWLQTTYPLLIPYYGIWRGDF